MVRPQPAKLLSPVQIWVAPPTIYNYFFTKCGSLAELVDSTGLENRRGLYLPGFESLRVHHLKNNISKYSKNISALIIKHFNKLDGEIFQKVAIKINFLEKEDKYSLKKKLLKYFIENDEKKKYSDINIDDESFCDKVIEDYKLSEYVILLNSISGVLNRDLLVLVKEKEKRLLKSSYYWSVLMILKVD